MSLCAHPHIDLNADLGEGYGRWTLGDDEALLDVVTSANLACGFHAGDPVIMRRTCRAAERRGVRIGAQVSYRDLAGFGRREMEIEPDELSAEVLYQIGALSAFGEVAYVKAHGALYNRCMRDPVQAGAVVAAVKAWRQPLPLLGLPDSELLRLASEHGIVGVPEGYADRTYDDHGRLRPRGAPGAVIHDAGMAADSALRLARSGRVRTLCVHGDTPGAVALARQVRARLVAEGLRLQAFA